MVRSLSRDKAAAWSPSVTCWVMSEGVRPPSTDNGSGMGEINFTRHGVSNVTSHT